MPTLASLSRVALVLGAGSFLAPSAASPSAASPSAAEPERSTAHERVVELSLRASDAAQAGRRPTGVVEHAVEFDGVLHVWATSEFDVSLRVEDADEGRRLAADDDSGGGMTPYVRLDAEAGQRLVLRVVGERDAEGAATLHLRAAPETERTRAAAARGRRALDEADRLLAGGYRAEVRRLVSEAVAELAGTPGAASSDAVASALFDLGWFAQSKLADPGGSLAAWETVRSHRESTLPAHHPELARTRLHAALSLEDVGALDEARALQEQALVAYESSLPEDHPALVSARKALAGTLDALGEPARARELREAVVAAYARNLAPDHPELMRAKSALIASMKAMGDEASAREVEESMLTAWTAAGAVPPVAGPEGGKWYVAREASAQPDGRQRERMDQLEALGYAAGVEEATATATGVTRHDVDATWPGYNFLVSGHAPVGILMDARGREVHRWALRADEVWPGIEVPVDRGFWRRARPLPDGDVLVIFENIGFARLDRRSKVLWKRRGLAHHDLDVDDDGTIYLLEREAKVVPWVHKERPVLDDHVTILGADGRERKVLSLLACIERSELRDDFERQLRARVRTGLAREAAYRKRHAERIAADPERFGEPDLMGDVLHTNTIQWLDGSGSEVLPAFAEGNLLLCLRSLDRIVVLDPEAEVVVWSLSGRWHAQHESTLLDNGRVLLFDNRGPARRGLERTSEVLEVDPVSGEVVWSYRAAEPDGFFSGIAGTCQRLENGNTLIVESTRGRAFEVDRAGTIVWEFQSPHRAGDDRRLVAFLPDLVRLPAEEVEDWLGR